MEHRHQHRVDDAEADDDEQDAENEVSTPLVDQDRVAERGHCLAPPHDDRLAARDWLGERLTQLAHNPRHRRAHVDHHADTRDIVAGIEPLAGGRDRNVNHGIVELRDTALEDPDDAHKLSGDVFLRVLRRQDEARAEAQLQAVDQPRTDVGGQPIIRREVATLDALLVEGAERRLGDRVDAEDLRRSRARSGARKPADREAAEHRGDPLGDLRRFERRHHRPGALSPVDGPRSSG